WYGAGGERVGNDIGPGIISDVRRAAFQVRDVAADLEIVWRTGACLEDIVELPIARDPGGRSAREPALASAKREFVDCRPREEMRDIVTGHATRGALVVVILNRRSS